MTTPAVFAAIAQVQMNAQAAIFPAAWFLMVLVLLLAVGIVSAIVWRSWVAGGIVLLFIVVIFGYVFTVRSSYDVATTTSPAPMIVHEEVNSSKAPWEPAPELLADVYPSMEEAAISLGTRLRDQIASRHPTKKITYISYTGDPTGSADDVIHTLIEAHPDAKLGPEDKADNDPGALTVKTVIKGTERNPMLEVIATSRGFRHSETAGVQSKQWVSNLAAYAEANPGRNFIVGKSSTPAANSEDAKRQARRDAARQLVPVVLASYPQLSSNPPRGDQQWLIRHLENQLALGRFNRKEFVQRLYLLNSGNSYRAAVLAEASSGDILNVNTAAFNEYSSGQRRVRKFGFGTVGLAILICVLYLFLNRATRGYFQMNLRLAASIVLVAGVLLILMITGF